MAEPDAIMMQIPFQEKNGKHYFVRKKPYEKKNNHHFWFLLSFFRDFQFTLTV